MAEDQVTALLGAVKERVFGQKVVFERLLAALLCDGHILLEGLPGLAKTTAVKTFAAALGLSFSRIQFTPDLLPGDIIGTQMLHPQTFDFKLHKGPIFANLVLADEINRSPAKVQSALLEAMQERHVTIGEQSFALPAAFIVLATQNPIEHEGTYPLPEAQVDRFMFKVVVDYPQREAEQQVLAAALSGTLDRPCEAVMSFEQIVQLKQQVTQVRFEPPVREYVLDIVACSRQPERFGLEDLSDLIEYGISPRGGIFLALAARAQAFLNGRTFVTPDDVQAVAYDVLRHRLGLSFQAEAEEVTWDDVIRRMLTALPVP